MNSRLHSRLLPALLLVGPGIFGVGYTIGTGAVTKLAAAGAQAGLQRLWALLIGGLLFWALMEASGRYVLVTGETPLHGFRTRLPGGRWWALVILAGVVSAQWTGLPVLVGLVAQLSYEGLRLLFTSAPVGNPAAVVGIGAVLSACVYGLLFAGRYALLEKTMVAVVITMIGGFAGAWGMIALSPDISASGQMLPPLSAGGGAMLIVAVIGTSVAAPTFLVRPLLMKAKGWGGDRLSEQRRDAAVGALIIFILGVVVMACATGAFHLRGIQVGNVFDAVNGLERVAGRLAAGLFLLGVWGAGVSSIIPMTMILPLLLEDYRSGELQLRTPAFRRWTALACLAGLGGPLWGGPLLTLHRTCSQIAQVVVLPLAVGGIFLLLNRADLMGGQRAGFWLNAALFAAFGFALLVARLALVALEKRFV